MTLAEWEQAFKPLVNHLDPYASWQDEKGNGIMFETYGEELAFVMSQDPDCIWTYVDGDEGTWLTHGFHLCNRIGYFVTREPYLGDDFQSICVNLDDEYA